MRHNSSESVVPAKSFGAPEWMMVSVFAIELLTMPAIEPNPNELGAVSIGLFLGLPSMLAAWSAVRSGAWRYVLTVLLALLNGFVLTYTVNHSFDLLLVLLPLVSAIPTLVTLWLIKRSFGRFAQLESGSDCFLEGLRFNLSHLFVVTTLLAVLLAVGKLFEASILSFVSYPGEIVIVACLAALFSLNTLMFVWALMGQKSFLRVCIAIPISLGLLVSCNEICNGADRSTLAIWYTVTGLPLLLSFLLMTVFRYGGWRFWKAAK